MLLRFLYYLRKAIIFSFIALLIGIILLFTVPIIRNNSALNRFSNQLNECLPKNTSIIEIQKTCGHLSGNNNGMEFLTVALIQSDSSLDELSAYYHNYNFTVALPDKLDSADSDGSVIVFVQKASAKDFVLPYELGPDDYCTLRFQKYFPDNNLYYIAIYDGKYLFSLDLRSG